MTREEITTIVMWIGMFWAEPTGAKLTSVNNVTATKHTSPGAADLSALTAFDGLSTSPGHRRSVIIAATTQTPSNGNFNSIINKIISKEIMEPTSLQKFHKVSLAVPRGVTITPTIGLSGLPPSLFMLTIIVIATFLNTRNTIDEILIIKFVRVIQRASFAGHRGPLATMTVAFGGMVILMLVSRRAFASILHTFSSKVA